MSVLRYIESVWDGFEKSVVSRLDCNQKKLWNVLVFLVRFIVLAIPLHVLLWLNFDAYPLQVMTARSVSFLLDVSGIAHVVNGIFLILPFGASSWTIEIIKDCVGWKSFMAVFGLMFAVRKVRIDRRVLGVVAAAPIIFAGNVFRIFSSIYLTRIFGFEWFDFIHGVLWQWGLIALVIAIWWVWLVKFANVSRTRRRKRS